MTASLTQKEFSQHLGTPFCVDFETSHIDLNLAEVQGYAEKDNEQKGLERFSVFFDGPAEAPLPQRTYHLKHERMGEFDLFLVPIASGEKGFRYEAVFNYFK